MSEPSADSGREPWQDQPPVTRAVVGIAGTMVTLTGDVFGYSLRMTNKAETLLDEYIGFLQDARPLVASLSRAVDSGLIDDVRSVIRILEVTVNQVASAAEKLDKLTTQVGKAVPTIDKTAAGLKKMLPVMETLPETQRDIHEAREAVARVETLVNHTLGQVGTLPGAKLMRGLAGGVLPKSATDPH